MGSTFSFAHMADVHLGAYSKQLRQLNLDAFLAAVDRSLARKVDFILIAGDLFHINVPDLAVVERAAAKLREAKDAGVPVYVWYGSHDYSPTEKSIIDVLASAGLFTKVARAGEGGAAAAADLEWTLDARTGAKIVAVAGKAQGLDRHVFHELDRDALEREGGFKIFGFHAAVREFLPPYLAHIDAVELADFPRGFGYYAGGHIHHFHAERRADVGLFVNPGPTFGSDGRDLLNREPRGFVVVKVEDGQASAAFEPIEVVPFVRQEVEVAGKSAQQARAALAEALAGAQVQGKAVVLRVHGELTSGQRADLDLDALYAQLPKQGAAAVHIVKAFSVAQAQRAQGEAAAPQEEMERRTLEAHVARFAASDPRLAGAAGVRLMQALQALLSEEPPAQRGGKGEFEARLTERALELLLPEEPVSVEPGTASAPAMAPDPAPLRSLEEYH